MNLKFYLRGLGIGIVVTVILMSIATRNQGDLTDDEIKARATALGMVEQKVLADISTPVPEMENTVTTQAPVITAEPEGTEGMTTAEPTATPTAEPTAEPTATPTAEPTATPTAVPSGDVGQNGSMTLIIKSGETSWSISKALYDAGVIENASDFDAYLCQNGYDKSIRTGTFEIPIDATYEEIAKKIAR